jgi:hypothetical protein
MPAGPATQQRIPYRDSEDDLARKIATFDSKTTHALGLYRTNGPIFIQSTLHHELSS